MRGELAEAAGDSIEANETAAAGSGDDGSATEPQADGAAELVEDAGADLQPEEPSPPVAGETSAGASEPLEASAFEGSAVETADSATAPSETSAADGAVETEESAASPDSEENEARESVEAVALIGVDDEGSRAGSAAFRIEPERRTDFFARRAGSRLDRTNAANLRSATAVNMARPATMMSRNSRCHLR